MKNTIAQPDGTDIAPQNQTWALAASEYISTNSPKHCMRAEHDVPKRGHVDSVLSLAGFKRLPTSGLQLTSFYGRYVLILPVCVTSVKHSDHGCTCFN